MAIGGIARDADGSGARAAVVRSDFLGDHALAGHADFQASANSAAVDSHSTIVPAAFPQASGDFTAAAVDSPIPCRTHSGADALSAVAIHSGAVTPLAVDRAIGKAVLWAASISGVAKGLLMGLKRGEMSTVAEQLRLAREAQKLTVYQVAEITKIRTDHIRALEDGNFNVFSAPVYIKGFVRTYAGLLKLDTPQIMTTLDEELGQTEKFREPPALSEQSGGVLNFITLQLSKLNRRTARAISLGVVGLLLFVGIVWLWSHHKSADPLANLGPGTYQPVQSGETMPLPAGNSRHP
jgi:hypothetical protein